MQGLIGSMCFVYVGLAWMLGDLNFWFNMYPFYSINHLATYHHVNPSQTFTYDFVTGGVEAEQSGQPKRKPLPTQGKRYQDAGKIYFESGNIKVDRSKAVSFRNHDMFCVAPIVDTRCEAAGENGCGYDFWAVGVNCCGVDDQVEFLCGLDPNNPDKLSRAPAAIRAIDNHDKPFYRLAVLEAEGSHGIRSKHPLFVEFLREKTPEQRTVEYGRAGYINLVVSVLLIFCFNFTAIVVLAKKIPELAYGDALFVDS